MISATHPKPDVPWPLKFQAQTWANCNNITVMVHAKVFGLNHLNQSFLCWGSHSCSTGSKERMFHDGCVCVCVCLCVCVCVCVCAWGNIGKLWLTAPDWAALFSNKPMPTANGSEPWNNSWKHHHQYHDHHHHNDRRGCQTPGALSNGVSTGYRFLSSYHFPKRWLHTLIKEFILCFLCEMSAYNHQIYMFFDKISFLQSWNDAMACARHTVSLQGPTWNLKVTCSECEFAACEAFSWTAAFRAPHLRSSLWRYHHSDVSNHGRVNGEQST